MILQDKILYFCECFNTTLNVSEPDYANTDLEFMNSLNSIFYDSDNEN